jgi:hypothetical protein
MTTPYTITRKRAPTTGEPLMAAAPNANRWAIAAAPMTEPVAMTMRSQLGACALDPSLGVNWRAIDKLRTGASATARFVIEQALARYVTAGLIANVVVAAEVVGARVEWDVAFTDPRTKTRPRITGSRTLT